MTCETLRLIFLLICFNRQLTVAFISSWNILICISLLGVGFLPLLDWHLPLSLPLFLAKHPTKTRRQQRPTPKKQCRQWHEVFFSSELWLFPRPCSPWLTMKLAFETARLPPPPKKKNKKQINKKDRLNETKLTNSNNNNRVVRWPRWV